MYTLTGFDLTTHSSNLLGGGRRRYHLTTPSGGLENGNVVCCFVAEHKEKLPLPFFICNAMLIASQMHSTASHAMQG
jgi:hypothetical protein